MAATQCTLPTRVPVEALASCTGRTSQTGVQTRPNVHFPRVGRGTSLISRQNGMHYRVRERKVHCAAEPDEGKSCCGGSGGDGGEKSGKCSSHGSSMDTTVDTSGIGKEFEALVAQKTMQQFESQYETGQLEGTISRDVISDVINIYPEAASTKRTSSQEKFLDVDELLAEASALSSKEGDFIFDADFEDSLV